MANARYIKKVEEKVEELMAQKPIKKKKKVKGFLESKKDDTQDKKIDTDIITIIAGHVVKIRKKRMELKNGA
tara:strand:- start:7735 stop:7950 length:216 start_codon:yes stop_codon:yes gene_type:complete